MELDKRVAKSIVENVMKGIDHNINIMDSTGVIIASGNKKRIGTLHEGALIAITRGSEFIADEKSIKFLNNTEEGINVVIKNRDEIVGVIGITGNNKLVEKHIKLIKIMAEIYIEDRRILEEVSLQKEFKEKLIINLLLNKNVNIPPNYTLKILEKRFSAVGVMEIRDGELINDREIDKLKNMSEINTCIRLNGSEVVFILSDNKIDKIENKILETIKKIQSLYKYRIYIGNIYEGENSVYNSYKSICKLREIKDTNAVMLASDYIYEMLIWDIRDSKLKKKVIETWNGFLNRDKSNELENTLIKFYHNDCKSSVTAQQLDIHRNTLDYRLNKIYEITKYHPKNIKSLSILMMARQLHSKNMQMPNKEM